MPEISHDDCAESNGQEGFRHSQPVAHFNFAAEASTLEDFRSETVNLKAALAATTLPSTFSAPATLVYERAGMSSAWGIEILAHPLQVFPPSGTGFLKKDWALPQDLSPLPSTALLKAGGAALIDELQFFLAEEDTYPGALDGILGVFMLRSVQCLTGEPQDEDRLFGLFAEPAEDICQRVQGLLDAGALQAKYPGVRFGGVLQSGLLEEDERSLIAFVSLDSIREMGAPKHNGHYPENAWLSQLWRDTSPF